MTISGIPLVGFSADIGWKIVWTIVLILGVILVLRVLGAIVIRLLGGSRDDAGHARARFWTIQGRSLATLLLVTAGILSIWFDDPQRLASVLGLIGAGIAVALQRVITAFAGYIVLLGGKVFTVGDRITLGGVRGDVVALGFIQTTVLEMGQTPGEQGAEPAMWITSRQYTGRIVRVTNDRIFDAPVFNYTKEFPYLWEELQIPITYTGDRHRAEQILLDTAQRHTAETVTRARPAFEQLRERYYIRGDLTLTPTVFYRLTDNWIELTIRFLSDLYSVRMIKDRMSRDIVEAFHAAEISIASSTYDIVGMPRLEVEVRTPVAQDPMRK
jgi:small-conductance mechanosensitive channel